MKVLSVLKKRVPTASYKRVLLTVAFLSSAVACMLALFGKSVLRNGSVGDCLMTDYWETVRFALSPTPYGAELHSSYAPVAFIIVYPFALICKSVAFSLPAAQAVRTWQFQLSFWLFFILCFCACAYLTARFTSRKTGAQKRSLFTVASLFLCSAPVYFTVIRANVIIAALVFLLLFLNFYESERSSLRWLAYLSLAVAGGIKFYTLAFGVLLVRKGRMQDCLKVLLLFIAVFFVPFVFYGKEGITGWFSHVNAFLNETGTTVYFHNVSCIQLLIALFDKLNVWFGVPLATGTRVALVVVQVLFGVVFLFCALFTKNDLRAFRLTTLLCCMIANPSYFYIAIFLYPLIFLDLQRKTLPLPLCFSYLVMGCCLTLVKWWAAIPHCVILLVYALYYIVITAREIFKENTPRALGAQFRCILRGFRYNRLK